MRDAITGTIGGTGRDGNVALDTVRDTTANTLRTACSVGGEAGHVAPGAIVGTLHATGNVSGAAGDAVRNATIGTVGGVRAVMVFTAGRDQNNQP